MAKVLPLSKALHDSNGRLIAGGLFGVPHKVDYDRVIYDRRPLNALERPVPADWIALPQGCQLADGLLRPHEGWRASGQDLETYFYVIRHHEGQLARGVVGRPHDGSDENRCA